MKTIKLIIQREFFTRVKKRSFLVMSIIGPLLIALLFIVPAWIQKMDSESDKLIAVIDDTHMFHKTIKDEGNVHFTFLENMTIDDVQDVFEESNYYALLFIPKNIVTSSKTVTLHSNRHIGFGVQMYIKSILEDDIKNLKLHSSGVDIKQLILADQPINIVFEKWNDDGSMASESLEQKMNVAIGFSMLIYIFILFFGNMVMRGVVEEKVNRIVEIVISSVKPTKLMIGKIVGIGLVGLLQFFLWIVFSLLITYTFQITVFADVLPSAANPTAQTLGEGTLTQLQNLGGDDIEYALNLFDSIKTINWSVMIGAFLFLFTAGYLLYASIFAALGSAVDSETDTQQFMMPLTIPLFLSILLIQVILNDPDGSVAFWLSMIPLTSPIAMLARLPFSVPIWQFLLSSGILIGSIYVSTRFAAKVYKTGILMYGKKASWKEIIRWARYKN